MAVVRPKDRVSVRHPSGNGYVGLDPAQAYDPDDPIVKAYPDHFGSDNDVAAPATAITAPTVEQATADPGEKRSLGRTGAKDPRGVKSASKVASASESTETVKDKADSAPGPDNTTPGPNDK